MFEFVCDHIIPGCSHTDRADTAEKVLTQARDHLRDHHGMEYIDEPLLERVRSVAIAEIAGR